MTATYALCQLTDRHCEQCGNTDPSDLAGSYSSCCNELVVVARDCRGHHAAPDPEPTKPKPEPKPKPDPVTTENPAVDLTEGRCTCGCGAETKPKSRFKQGHDARLKGALRRAHAAKTPVTVTTGDKTRTATALQAARQLDTERFSWSEALKGAK